MAINAVLSVLDTLSRSGPLMEGSKQKLRKTLALLVGFCAGCVAGAAAVSWMGKWAWFLPVVLAASALAAVPARRSAST